MASLISLAAEISLKGPRRIRCHWRSPRVTVSILGLRPFLSSPLRALWARSFSMNDATWTSNRNGDGVAPLGSGISLTSFLQVWSISLTVFSSLRWYPERAATMGMPMISRGRPPSWERSIKVLFLKIKWNLRIISRHNSKWGSWNSDFLFSNDFWW